MNKDYLAPGIPCAFFNFEGHFDIEAKVRKLLSDTLSPGDSLKELAAKTIQLFKQNNIEKVIWSYAGYAIFWYIGD